MEDGFSLEHSTVGIIGLGLMGGSLAMSLKGKCARLVGFDSHPPTLELALSHQIVDYVESDPAKCLSELDLLILATPVPAIINYLHQLQSTNYHLPLIILDF
ncbi:MAG: NAD(P)-binding domain-containing protein, partial [Anaerolineales bacterium]|nr:NAD(P)-binding domain-containing protein [Anaerolineales bacterium]